MVSINKFLDLLNLYSLLKPEAVPRLMELICEELYEMEPEMEPIMDLMEWKVR